MGSLHVQRLLFVGALLSVAVAAQLATTEVQAQEQAATALFEPEEGQEGKDVVWVPTRHALVKKMLDIANVTPKDYVIDLGSGDGRTVIAAAKRGARALGIEYKPEMVELSKRRAAEEGVSDKASFVKADLFEADFSKATVITMFLLPSINLRLRPKILDLKPGTRIVSNSFDMEKWKADETAEVKMDCESYCTALLWIVPAKVAGAWEGPEGTLALKQTFQMVSGMLTSTSGTKEVSISAGKLRGDQLTFRVGDAVYSGRVSGDSMEGTVKMGGQAHQWKARRIRSTEPAATKVGA